MNKEGSYEIVVKPEVLKLGQLCRNLGIPYLAVFQLSDENGVEEMAHSVFLEADSSETLHRCAELLDAQRIEEEVVH